jgi:hypothetical protein
MKIDTYASQLLEGSSSSRRITGRMSVVSLHICAGRNIITFTIERLVQTCSSYLPDVGRQLQQNPHPQPTHFSILTTPRFPRHPACTRVCTAHAPTPCRPLACSLMTDPLAWQSAAMHVPARPASRVPPVAGEIRPNIVAMLLRGRHCQMCPGMQSFACVAGQLPPFACE